MLLLAGVALAETDPIVCNMEVSPSTLTAPGPVDVTITISNSGDTDMKDPVTLYNPVSQVVTDFGDNGSATLKAGESKTWTGKWDVNQRTLDNGSVVYFVKYTLYKDSGEAYSRSQPIRGSISGQTAQVDVEIKRTISPGTARKDQAVTIQYDIVNRGTVAITDISIQESITKEPQKIKEVKPGEKGQAKFNVKMGTKDLTSKATITYTPQGAKKAETKTVEEQKIIYGEPAMNTKLTSSAKGVAVNGKVTLTLELKNNGNVDYSDLRVSDSTLGDVFTNQKLEKNGTLKLEKEITLTATTDYQFTITAIDNTGTQVSVSTDVLTITAVDPDKMLHLSVVTTPDRTEVYEQPGKVRFSVAVTNDSEVEAKDVTIYHGSVKIYTFASIPAGQTRTLTRDAALSMPGKYQFTASTVDALSNTVTFPSNEVQIAFSLPTPAPATPTPPTVPTPEPTFSAVTMPPITHPSIGAIPKLIHSILLPILIISGLMLIGSGVLLIIATKRRADQKKASEAAFDHLERSKRRDYVSPAEVEEDVLSASKEKKPEAKGESSVKERKRPAATGEREVPVDDVELPHLKYVRNAYERTKGKPQTSENYGSGSLYDDDLYGMDEDVFTKPNQDGIMYEEPYGGAYDDGIDNETSGDPAGDSDYDAGYAQEYSDDYDDAYDDYDSQSDVPVDGSYGDDRVDDPYEEQAADGFDDTPSKRVGRSKGEPRGTDMGY